MKKTVITIAIILAIAGIYILPSFNLTGNSILDKYSHTTAICNENNFCEDYQIECDGSSIISITPTGFSIQHDSDWKDSRDTVNYCSN